MNTEDMDRPGLMPLDRQAWYLEIHLSNFVNSYCQYRDIQLCRDVRKILEVGCGQGLSTQVLRWKGYEVTTLDVDETFRPDHVGSIHDMACFDDRQFDVLIASHVLEHLPVSLLNESLREMARVARYALVYLPIAGTHHFQIRLLPGFHGLDFTFHFDFYNYFETPTGVEPRYCQGQHYWEVGYRGFRPKDLVTRFSPYFAVLKRYRNRDWNPSYNFILQANSR
ncbi:MAG TPA: methyltransferase domain-containing protein [Sedimentisphaerales bacterium]|nr:methyltransferase domain-containing protein [Sedimentisphaerales bacterium]